MTDHERGWNLALNAAANIALDWQKDNKSGAASARKQGDKVMADMLDGAAIECNALAGEILNLLVSPTA